MEIFLYIALFAVVWIGMIGCIYYLLQRRRLTPLRFVWIFTTFFNLPLAIALLILSGMFQTKPIQSTMVINMEAAIARRPPVFKLYHS